MATPIGTAEIGARLSDLRLQTPEDVLQMLLEVIALQRDCVNSAPAEKKSIELKRAAGAIKVYHQFLQTVGNKPIPTTKPAVKGGAISRMLSEVFADKSRKSRQASKTRQHVRRSGSGSV